VQGVERPVAPSQLKKCVLDDISGAVIHMTLEPPIYRLSGEQYFLPAAITILARAGDHLAGRADDPAAFPHNLVPQDLSTHLKTITSRDELMITARFLTISSGKTIRTRRELIMSGRIDGHARFPDKFVRQNYKDAPGADHVAARIDDHVPFPDNLVGKTIRMRRELILSRDELIITLLS